ncbi:MAG: acyl-ACP--UDP-N-acetylglucosamine O-acyltransferase [Planctomycetota bacterium]
MIHPSAIIHPQAQLAANVEVGPFAIVESGVEVGSGTVILARAHLSGNTKLGRDCEVHMGAVLGHLPQDLNFDPEIPSGLQIGDRCVFRENVTVHRATREGESTTIGNDNYFMAQSHLAHDCRVGNHVIMCNNALAAGHVEIGDGVFISGNSVIHQFCRLGEICMVSGISGTSQDVPPYTIVTGRSQIRGLNVVGLRRAGFDLEARCAVKEVYRKIFRAHGDFHAAMKALEEAPDIPEIETIRRFYRKSSIKGFAWPLRGADS